MEGLSFLNKDQRSNLASAFSIDAQTEDELLAELKSSFEQLPNLDLNIDATFPGTFGQLGKDIKTHLLIAPHIENPSQASDLRSHLSFKIMDRLDDIAGEENFLSPKRITGTSPVTQSAMTFYWLQTRQLSLVIYFCSAGTCREA